jgi:alanine dehydrogenase
MICKRGHKCYVEHDAGLGSGFGDYQYEQAGARIVYSPHEVFGRADLLVKVARPTLEEINWLRSGTAITGLLHLNSSRVDKIDALIQNEITSIALEQIQLDDGRMPVHYALAQIGGLMVPQVAARLLQNEAGGKGILLGGIVGVPPAEVVIIGGGIVGTCATQGFLGMGAHVTVMDIDIRALQRIHDRYFGVVTIISNPVSFARVLAYADVVVGAVLVPGERAPVVITREMLRSMKPRSILMDVSIDEGGCAETSRPTTHDHPTFIEEGIIHYCVPNMPGVVARSSTHAFVNSALPFILEMTDKGIEAAIDENPAIEKGTNTRNGKIVHLSSFAQLLQED